MKRVSRILPLLLLRYQLCVCVCVLYSWTHLLYHHQVQPQLEENQRNPDGPKLVNIKDLNKGKNDMTSALGNYFGFWFQFKGTLHTLFSLILIRGGTLRLCVSVWVWSIWWCVCVCVCRLLSQAWAHLYWEQSEGVHLVVASLLSAWLHHQEQVLAPQELCCLPQVDEERCNSRASQVHDHLQKALQQGCQWEQAGCQGWQSATGGWVPHDQCQKYVYLLFSFSLLTFFLLLFNNNLLQAISSCLSHWAAPVACFVRCVWWVASALVLEQDI